MSIISRTVKIAKYISITLASILLSSLIISSFLLFSHTGNQALISLAKQFESRLSIDLIKGSLFHAPQYQNIAWEDGDTHINIASLDYRFKWSCLTQALCLQSLNIDGATISLPELSTHTSPESKTDSAPLVIELPIKVKIDNISLTNITFKMGELSVELDKLLLQADGAGKDISLASQINGLLITLPASSDELVKTKKIAVSKNKKQMDLSLKSLPAILTAKMLPTVKLPLNLNIQPIIIEQLKVLQNQHTLFELTELKTVFTFIESKLSISQFTLDIPETRVNLKGEINFIDNYPLDINIDGRVKSIKQLQPETLLKDLDYVFTSKGSLSDLSSELLLSNKINLQLSTHLDLFAPNLPHHIQLDWQNINWPLTGKSQYGSKQGRFSSKGSLVDHQIDLQTEYALTDLPGGKVSLKTQGDLQQLQIETLKVETLDGEIDFSGLLTWKDRIDWLGQLTITDINIEELKTPYDAQLSGLIKQQAAVTLYENSAPEWQFDFPELHIEGELLTRPLSILGHISGNDKQGIRFEKLAINNAENSLVVNGLLAKQNELNIDLNIIDISHAVIGAKGAIDGRINLTGPFKMLAIQSKLNAHDLSYKNYQLEKLNLDSKVILTTKPQVALVLKATQLTVDNQVIDNIDIDITNKSVADDNVKHQIELVINSEIISTDLMLYLTQTDDDLIAELNQGKLFLPYQTLILTKPFQITEQKNNISITDHCWQARADNIGKSGDHEAGKLCIDEFNVGESGKVAFDIDKYLLANINPFLPDEFKMAGALSANADLKWEKDSKANFTVNITSDDMLLKMNSDPQKQAFKNYPLESFHIDVKGSDENVVITANIFSDKLINIEINGQIAPYKKIPTMDSSVEISLPDFALLLPLIPQLERLEGQLNSQLKITGKLKKPTINGSINIQQGYISSPALPMKISELQSEIQINNTQATILGSFNTSDTNMIGEKTANIPLLTNTLNIFDKSIKKVKDKIIKHDKANIITTEKVQATPGIAFIKGQFDWSKKLMGDVHFYAHKLEIYDYGKIDLLVSPDIKLQVNENISVKGGVFIDKGKVVVKQLPAGAISQSKDIIVVDVKKDKVAPDLPIIIDLSLDLGNQFKLVALGLNSFIEGKLLVKKPLEKDLSINGELNFVDGSYRSLGQQLILQKSRVIFQGAPDSPYLSIEAIRDPNKIQDNVTAGVRVTGTPDELELVIFSEPAMSQQEALSYLTRGQSLDSSSDSSTMANMLIDIAAGQSDGLMSSIGEGVGIKDLSLSSSGTGTEQSVGVRGEIAPGVEISYGVGVFDSFSIFSIRYEMFERFYIEASSGIDQAVDAYYEWDWDY
jgi:translocation and assembly module TamB